MKARLPEGYGPQNTGKLMQQVQKMQDEMASVQAELAEKEYTATVGGGLVSLTMLGSHQVTGVKIQPDAAADDIEMLEDLVAAAVNEAIRQVEEDSTARMEAITGGLNLPGVPGLG